jgi:hypothetical protein
MPVSKTITYLRGDSALYQAGVINFCSERGTLFTITADQDKGVKEAIKTIKEWQPYDGDREIGETIHTMVSKFYYPNSKVAALSGSRGSSEACSSAITQDSSSHK